ncbi:hypothetical protein Tco_1180439 [Tanacetum coccineum]
MIGGDAHIKRQTKRKLELTDQEVSRGEVELVVVCGCHEDEDDGVVNVEWMMVVVGMMLVEMSRLLCRPWRGDPGVPDGQVVQTIIPNTAAFQTKDLNTYNSDCDDLSNAQAVLMANISNYGSDVISDVPHS